MIIVFDTTETFRDLRMEGPNFRMMQAYMSATSSTLAVPQIVFEETVNHFRERLSKSVQSCGDRLREINTLIASEQAVPELKIDEAQAVENYRSHLESRIRELCGSVIGFENIKLAAIVERSLQRRKPFDGEGRKGFRDAILWETVLHELLQKVDAQSKVALITKNSHDFGKDGVLADALLDDCKRIDRTDCITLFDNLQAFVDAEVKPHLDTLEDIYEQIREGEYKQFDPLEFFATFSESIQGDVRNRVRRCDFNRLTRWMTGTFHSHDLHSLESIPERFEVVDVWSIDENQVAAEIEFTVKGELECIQTHEVYYPEGDEVFSEVFDEGFVGDATFKVSATVVLGKDTGETDDFEINKVETTLGQRWPHLEYK